MVWMWWLGMAFVGLILGFIGAWTTGAARVFVKTLAVPLIILLARVGLPSAPGRAEPLYILADFLILATTGLIGDYFLGLKLGRNDRQGFREDSVGH